MWPGRLCRVHAHRHVHASPLGRHQGIACWLIGKTVGINFDCVMRPVYQGDHLLLSSALVKRRYDARSGETSIGASGASQSWGEFNDSDVIKKVKAAYSRRQIAGF